MFSIIIPLYNEAENIRTLIDEIEKNLKDYTGYEIILIDDASEDGTLEIIKKINNNKIVILNNSENKGQSISISRGINKSLNNMIITLDGDGQNDPADIPKLIKIYSNEKDIELVGGIRLNRKDNFVKKISSRIANNIRSAFLKDGCIDTGCSLKIFNRKIFLSFPYFDGIHRFLPALFTGFGYKTSFINVNHRVRRYGVSKYGTFNRLFKGIRDIIRVKKILKIKK